MVGSSFLDRFQLVCDTTWLVPNFFDHAQLGFHHFFSIFSIMNNNFNFL